jgi:hypothetical protein
LNGEALNNQQGRMWRWNKGGVRTGGGGETTRRGNDGSDGDGDGDGNNDDANGDSGDDVNFGDVGDGNGSRGWQRWR